MEKESGPWTNGLFSSENGAKFPRDLHQRREDRLKTWPCAGVCALIRHSRHILTSDEWLELGTDLEQWSSGALSSLSTGEEWRNREEVLEHLLKSIPLNKRGHGAEQWRMSLRDSWERWVPVGSIFSGLFAAVYDKPSVKDSRYLAMFNFKPI